MRGEQKPRVPKRVRVMMLESGRRSWVCLFCFAVFYCSGSYQMILERCLCCELHVFLFGLQELEQIGRTEVAEGERASTRHAPVRHRPEQS